MCNKRMFVFSVDLSVDFHLVKSDVPKRGSLVKTGKNANLLAKTQRYEAFMTNDHDL